MFNEFLKNWLKKNVSDKRPPDFIIGDPKDPYMLRWWVIPRNKWFNIYLHLFLHSDEDRAEHTHPWISISCLLDKPYREWGFHCPDKFIPWQRFTKSDKPGEVGPGCDG